MSRRLVNLVRHTPDNGSLPFVASIQSKSRSSPVLSIVLVVVKLYPNLSDSEKLEIDSFLKPHSIAAPNRVQFFLLAIVITIQFKHGYYVLSGGTSCTSEVIRALPILKKAYGDSMHKILHVGPDTCSVVTSLLREEDTEAWGIEPYELDDVDANCKSFVRKGFVRAADIKFPLPYRAKSFSLVIVADALDYLSPRYLNKTLPELVRVSADGVVIFTGYPGQPRAKSEEVSKFGRPAKLRSSSWWIRFFVQTNLEENEAAGKKFGQASTKRSFQPACQVFHLKSYP